MKGEESLIEKDIVAAFDDIIEGRFVNRNVHELNHDGKDLTELFMERLECHGFLKKHVADINLQFEERVPTFAIRNGKAYFGWIFIERFTEQKSRKLFGSMVRNKKGDWLIQITQNSTEHVYANCQLKFGMEGERLFVME